MLQVYAGWLRIGNLCRVSLSHSFATQWAIRTTLDPVNYEGAVRNQIAQLGKQLFVTEIKPMDAYIEQSEAKTRLSLVLIGIFASLAALLSALGIYAVLSTSVRQRTSDIGVRMALGATRGNIFGLIVGQGVALGTIGILIGCTLALGLTRLISSILVGISPTDLPTFFMISIAFLLIVAVASWLPAARAASIDPMQALRSQ